MIGRGASSVVYAGVQERFGRTVAVKVLQIPGRDEVAARLFETECQTLGRLASHPDIVTVFDAGTTVTGDPYLVMEHLPGGTLAERLKQEGALAPDELLPIAVRLSGALATAHRNRIIHGDVKPQNVLWSVADLPALADFGIARLRTTTMSTALTVFTPLHAAPELFDGQEPSELTDVYGLGSTIFELVDGRPAAGDEGDSPLTVVGRIARGERRSLDPALVPAPLVDVVERAMAYEPADRFASVEELGDALRAVEQELGQPATRLVVLDLPAASSTSGTAAAEDEVTPPAEPSAAMTIPPPLAGPVGAPAETADHTEDGGSDGAGPDEDTPAGEWAGTEPPRRARGCWPILLFSAAMIAIGALGIVALLARDTDEAPTTTAAADGPTTTAFVETGNEPNGLQPDVTYDVPGSTDETPRLDAALADIGAITQPLGEVTSVQDNKLFTIDSTPATLRYRTFHPRDLPACRGFLSRPMTVTGQWSKLVQLGPDTVAVLTALRFEDADQAHEAFVALSIGQGPPAKDCSGFKPDWGVDDYDDLDIVHRDVELPDLRGTTGLNTFVGQGATQDFPMYTYSTAGAIQRDATVVAFAVLGTPAAGQVETAPLTQVLNNVLDRLPE
ncbi:protein kinase [Dermatobacter hominis]|nr:protein kinase [Dermatobacter hominis]